MNYLNSPSNTSKLVLSLQDGTALAVSDWSYFPNKRIGACAWKFSSSHSSEFIEGGGIIPGPGEEQSSYRSELGDKPEQHQSVQVSFFHLTILHKVDTSPQSVMVCQH